MKHVTELLKDIIGKNENNEAYTVEMTQSEKETSLLNSRGTAVFSIAPDRIICAASSSNYVVFYVDEGDGKPHERCVRTTLANVLDTFSPYLQQCHRSFLFNPRYLIQFCCISHDLYLTVFRESPIKVPVSDTYRDSVRDTVLSTEAQKG